MDFNDLMYSLLNSGQQRHPGVGGGMPNALLGAGQNAPAMPPPMPTQAQGAMQASQQAPSPQSAPQGNGGGFLSGLGSVVQGLVAPQSRGRNATVNWLQQQGMDEGTATLLAGNKPALQKYLLSRTQGADPMNALKLEKTQLEIENLRNPTTDDIKEYQFARKQGYTGTLPQFMQEMRKAGATNINNNMSPESGLFAGMPKDVRDEMFKRQSEAQDAADLIDVTNQGLQLLDQGAITGAGSGAKIAAIKWAQTLGVPVPDDVAAVANNTEAYRSIMAKAVGKVIKQFGSGTGLSDADRQYAERLAGGDTTLNEPAIRRILAAGAKQSETRIKGYKAMRDKVLGGDLSALLNVQAPSPYEQPETQGFQITPDKARALRAGGGLGAPSIGTVEDGYRFKGGDPGDPNSWERVQ